MSAWEISKFLNNFNSKYYKIDLLNTIATFSEKEEDELFIMKTSFNLENNYRYMKEKKFFLDDEKNMLRLYYLGIPISINSESVFFKKLGYYFEMIRKLNLEFYQYGLPKIERKVLFLMYSCIKDYINIRDDELIEVIKKVCEQNLKNFIIINKDDEKNLIELKRKIAKILNELDINKINSDFFEVFNKLERPVIGVYHKQDKSFEILCSYSVSPLATSDKKLDVKKIEHNSPTSVEMFVGGFSLIFLIPFLKSIFYKEKIVELKEYGQNIENLEIKIKKLEELLDEKDLDKVNSMKDSKLKKSLEIFKTNNINELKEILKKNKILNDSFNVEVIE